LEDLDIFMKALVNNEFFEFSKMINKDSEYLYGIRSFGDKAYGHSGQSLDSVAMMVVNSETKKTYILLVGDSSVDINGLLNSLLLEDKIDAE